MAVAESEAGVQWVSHQDQAERPNTELVDFLTYASKPREELARDAVRLAIELHDLGYLDADKLDYLLREVVSRHVEWKLTNCLHTYFLPYAGWSSFSPFAQRHVFHSYG